MHTMRMHRTFKYPTTDLIVDLWHEGHPRDQHTSSDWQVKQTLPCSQTTGYQYQLTLTSISPIFKSTE